MWEFSCGRDSYPKINSFTGGPRYIREIRNPKIGSNITNSHIKRPRMTVN
jgi:hypothetical protein